MCHLAKKDMFGLARRAGVRSVFLLMMVHLFGFVPTTWFGVNNVLSRIVELWWVEMVLQIESLRLQPRTWKPEKIIQGLESITLELCGKPKPDNYHKFGLNRSVIFCLNTKCSCSRGSEFEYQILDGHFCTLFCFKNCFVCFRRPKINEKEAHFKKGRDNLYKQIGYTWCSCNVLHNFSI